MLKDLIEKIKIKDRDKFAASAKNYWQQLRIWLQDNGEWALVVGVGVGILFVLFFKLIIVLIVIGGLASYLIWELSSPSASASSSSSLFDNSEKAGEKTRQNGNSNGITPEK